MPGLAGAVRGPDRTRWTSSPATAPAAAVKRAWFDQRRPVVTRQSASSASAPPTRYSRLRILLPPNASGSRSSRLIQMSARPPSAAAKRGNGANGDGSSNSGNRGKAFGSGVQGGTDRWYPARVPSSPWPSGSLQMIVARPSGNTRAWSGRSRSRRRPWVRSGSIHRSCRLRRATGRGSTTTATARHRSTSCRAPRPTPTDGRGSRMRSRPPRATSSTSPQARSTSRRTPRRRSRSSSCSPATARIRTSSTSTADPTAPTTFRRPAKASTTDSVRQLLERYLLDDVPEEAFPNDGWSGATLTTLRRGNEGFVLKRTSRAVDWVARATNDIALREGLIAGGQIHLAEPLVAPYLGVGSDGEGIALLMPDLSNELIAWERPGHDQVVSIATLDRVIDAVARLHAMPWAEYRSTSPDWAWPWCPLRERLLLLSRRSAARYRADGVASGARFIEGWDAFDRFAPAEGRSLVADLEADPAPLLAALDRLPATGLHGDLKLANVALLDDGRVALIDWAMMSLAPVAVELGWLIVSNSASLPVEPEAVMTGYREAAERAAAVPLRLRGGSVGGPSRRPPLERDPDRHGVLPPRGVDATIGDWDAQVDLTWIVGLVRRGGGKALDTDAGAPLVSGVRAADDLAWWSERAVAAAGRRL